jgi:hypothetical protein
MDAPEMTTALSPQRISLETIDAVVATRLGETRVRGNAQPAVFNRQVAMYLAKHVGRWSTTRIGRFYNGRDHSTVCHALKKIEMLRNSHPGVTELLVSLQGEISSATLGKSSTTQPDVRHPAAQSVEILLTDEFLDLLIDRLLDRFRSSKNSQSGVRRIESPLSWKDNSPSDSARTRSLEKDPSAHSVKDYHAAPGRGICPSRRAGRCIARSVGLITERSVVQIHPQQPTHCSIVTLSFPHSKTRAECTVLPITPTFKRAELVTAR